VHPGLGWIAGAIRRLSPPPPLRVPQMGWNQLALHRSHPLVDGIGSGAFAYFVHSYALSEADPGQLLATTDHGGAVVAAIAHGNVAGTQFHPEKSQETGLRFLANFLRWQPSSLSPAGALADSGKTVLTGA